MHRFRSWTLGPPEWRTQRNRLLPAEGGDGSTLSLDFTTGVLDPRLTFTRASNATFINSSGLVQWAAANHAPRTNWNFTSPTGSGWNAATTSGTGTFQWVGDGTVIASSGSSGQAFISITTSTGIAEGLRYVMSVTAQSVTGSPTIQSIFDMTNASGNTYFKNGATATAGTTVASGDRISVSAVATATTMNVRMGCGAWFANRTNESVTLTQFHWHPGSSPVPYYENTATSPRYDSARFDCDPTTLAPKGLLIEGSATNSVFRSQALNTSPWNKAGAVSISETGSGSPANDSTSNVLTWTNSTSGGNAWTEQSLTVAGSQPYTWSVWLKPRNNQRIAIYGLARNSGGSVIGNLETTIDFSVSPPTATNTVSSGYTNVTTPTLTAYPNGWYRMVATGTTPATAATTTFGISNKDNVPATGTNGCEVWGAQFEAGSGASSYIPTGASTVQRVADFCTIPTSSFITGPLYPQTLFVECIPANPSAAFPDIVRLFDRTAGGTFSYGTELYYYGSSTMTAQRKINASTNSDRPLASGLAYNSRHKLAVAVDSSAFLGSYDGLTGSGTTTAPSALASQVTHMGIGCSGDASAGSVMFGTIRQIKFFPFAMAQSQLNALTTL